MGPPKMLPMLRFARVRGVSILPEIDGPMHAPALAAALNLTVAATVNFSLPQFAYEPPPGTWNISSLRAMQFVRTALEQAMSMRRDLEGLAPNLFSEGWGWSWAIS